MTFLTITACRRQARFQLFHSVSLWLLLALSTHLGSIETLYAQGYDSKWYTISTTTTGGVELYLMFEYADESDDPKNTVWLYVNDLDSRDPKYFWQSVQNNLYNYAFHNMPIDSAPKVARVYAERYRLKAKIGLHTGRDYSIRIIDEDHDGSYEILFGWEEGQEDSFLVFKEGKNVEIRPANETRERDTDVWRLGDGDWMFEDGSLPDDSGVSTRVPQLNSGREHVQMTEAGPSDIYLRSGEQNRGIVLYVDFKDVKGIDDIQGNWNKTIDFNRATEFFRQASGGNTALFLDHKNDSWKSLPKNAREYSGVLRESRTHIDFISETLSLYEGVNFNSYSFVIIVLPDQTPYTITSVSRSENFSHGYMHKGNRTTLRGSLVLGADIYGASQPENRLIHELGHLFGLPDLYPTKNDKKSGEQDADYSEAGPWGYMSDADRATRFLQWHNHILGWETNPLYITSGSYHYILSKHSSANKMLVFPLDDLSNPSKVLVVEFAPQIRELAPSGGRMPINGDHGFIAYTVDATITTGRSPIVIQCPRDTECGVRNQRKGVKYRANFPLNTPFSIKRTDGSSINIVSRKKTGWPDTKERHVYLEAEIISPEGHHELKKRGEYRQITFNDQIWLGEDLILDNDGAVCFSNKEENCVRYGRLYTWQAAKEACRQFGEGWRLPSDDDWKALTRSYGGAAGDVDDPLHDTYDDLVEGGESGFNAMLGGKRYAFADGGRDFYDLGKIGYYWTSDARNANDIISYTFRNWDRRVLRESITPQSQTACRCVRDNTEASQ